MERSRGSGRRLLPAALLLAIVAVAGACGSSATSVPAYPMTQAGAPNDGTGLTEGPMAAPTAAPAMPGGAESRSAAGGTGSSGAAAFDLANQALIVKTGTMTLEIDDLDAAITTARAAIEGLGGYVSASDRSATDDQKVASVTYRIPAARWEDALDALHKLGKKLVAEQVNTQEVTGQVLDLGARIDNLQATEAALQAIMERATKISDVLDVQSQLTDVRGQIEQLSTEKSHLEQQAAYGTMTVTFRIPVTPAVTVVSKGWDPATEVDHAAAQLVEMGQGLASLLIWFVIVVLPVLVVLLIVGVPALLVLRRIARNSRSAGTPGWGAPTDGPTGGQGGGAAPGPVLTPGA